MINALIQANEAVMVANETLGNLRKSEAETKPRTDYPTIMRAAMEDVQQVIVSIRTVLEHLDAALRSR